MAPVWDFSGYNSKSTLATKATWIASLSQKSDLVLNRLFHYQEATVPADFGNTPANVEAHLAKKFALTVKCGRKQPEYREVSAGLSITAPNNTFKEPICR